MCLVSGSGDVAASVRDFRGGWVDRVEGNDQFIYFTGGVRFGGKCLCPGNTPVIEVGGHSLTLNK